MNILLTAGNREISGTGKNGVANEDFAIVLREDGECFCGKRKIEVVIW